MGTLLFIFVTAATVISTLALPCPETPTCTSEEWGQLKPYPLDCTKYIYCDQDGVSSISSCREGQHFSPERLLCISISLANCTACEEVLPTTPTEPSTTTVEVCPEILPTCLTFEYGIMKSYPLDCTKYIYCDTLGNVVLRTCAFGHHFNANENKCTSQEIANCKECLQTTEVITELTTIESNICTEFPTCSVLEWGETKPYPSNCSMYIYCDENGEAELSICSAGKHYSVDIKHCTTPEEANCKECIEEVTTPEITTVTIGNTTPENICPLVEYCSDLEWGETKPFPPNCSLYLYCDHGGRNSLSICPNDEHYSPTLQRCAHPDIANCPFCIESSTTEVPAETSTLTTEVTLAICPATPECSSSDLTGTQKPYPLDCNFYVYCDGTDTQSLRFCGLERHFSPTLLHCVSPLEANCPSCTELTTPAITEATVAVCPETPTCTLDSRYYNLPYPLDCTKYIYCNSKDIGELSYCLPGRHFSQATGYCALQEEANCTSCVGGGGREFTTTATVSIRKQRLRTQLRKRRHLLQAQLWN